MSSFQPYIDTSYPDYAAEAARAPYAPGPVGGVEGPASARPVAPTEERPEAETPARNDELSLSNAARAMQSGATAVSSATTGQVDLTTLQNTQYNLGIRDLLQTFQTYNNQDAVNRYNNYLDMFTRYGVGGINSGENDPVANLRAQENHLYGNLGITGASGTNVSGAVDRWLTGDGVFTPSMWGQSSSDGFTYTPLSDEAVAAALNAAESMASYERTRIAAYLRELAQLTPDDFAFSDPTGLGELALRERREFLARMDELLTQARIEERAAELRYVFSEEGELRLQELGLADQEELARLEQSRDQINSYYAALLASVQQYGAGVISDSM